MVSLFAIEIYSFISVLMTFCTLVIQNKEKFENFVSQNSTLKEWLTGC